MEDWLFNILKNNTLVDNQTYSIIDRIMVNHRLPESIRLKERSKGEHWKVWNDNYAVWAFLNRTGSNVNDLLKKNRDSGLIRLNEGEYEHNSTDDFINVNGVNSSNFQIATGNVIGYIKKEPYALKISSRFGDQFLQYIISEADGFIEIENYGGQKTDDGYEWLLIYLWKTKLKRAFRLGVPKQYKTQKEYLNRVRGKIDPISYFLNEKSGKYQCNYREHSYNTEAAKLISEVFIKQKDNELLSDVHSIKTAFINATQGVRTKQAELFNTPYFSNPFYHDYNQVINLSKLILRNELASFGNREENSAFFFDVSMLFEYFVRKLLIKSGSILKSKFEKRLEIPSGTFNNYKRKLEPDIVIEKEGVVHIFDVKYKSYDFRYGVKREDLFQLHTYIGQYTNEYTINSCGFIFPIEEANWKKYSDGQKKPYIKEMLQLGGMKIPFLIFFIVIPDETDTVVYNNRFRANNDRFIELINEL